MKCSRRVHDIISNGERCEDDAFAKCSKCNRGFCENHDILDECERKSCHDYVCTDCRNSTTISAYYVLCKTCYAIGERMLEETVSEYWEVEFEEWMDQINDSWVPDLLMNPASTVMRRLLQGGVEWEILNRYNGRYYKHIHKGPPCRPTGPQRYRCSRPHTQGGPLYMLQLIFLRVVKP